MRLDFVRQIKGDVLPETNVVADALDYFDATILRGNNCGCILATAMAKFKSRPVARSVVLNLDGFTLCPLAVFAAEDLIHGRLRNLNDCAKPQKLEFASYKDSSVNSGESDNCGQCIPQTTFYIVPLALQAHQFVHVRIGGCGRLRTAIKLVVQN